MRRGNVTGTLCGMASTSVLAFGAFALGLTGVGVLALILAVSALVSVFRNDELSGSAQAMWVVAIAFVPIFGSIVYFSVRSDW
jgi:hypothetical protein